MKITRASAASIFAVLILAAWSRAADTIDPHDHVIRNLPAVKTISAAASSVSFSTTNSIEDAAADAMEYYDAVSPVPRLDANRITIVGLVRVKARGVYLKDSRAQLPPGEYIHWVGKADGVWAAGFAESKGPRNLLADVRFAVMSGRAHGHLQVYTHSPEGASAWKKYVERKAVLPTPTLPPSLPGPPSMPDPEPPPPPQEWRCVEIWKFIEDSAGNQMCTITGWVRVPAN